jgi:hypothetical protein
MIAALEGLSLFMRDGSWEVGEGWRIAARNSTQDGEKWQKKVLRAAESVRGTSEKKKISLPPEHTRGVLCEDARRHE